MKITKRKKWASTAQTIFLIVCGENRELNLSFPMDGQETALRRRVEILPLRVIVYNLELKTRGFFPD
jgi:hypothetical protein